MYSCANRKSISSLKEQITGERGQRFGFRFRGASPLIRLAQVAVSRAADRFLRPTANSGLSARTICVLSAGERVLRFFDWHAVKNLDQFARKLNFGFNSHMRMVSVL